MLSHFGCGFSFNNRYINKFSHVKMRKFDSGERTIAHGIETWITRKYRKSIKDRKFPSSDWGLFYAKQEACKKVAWSHSESCVWYVFLHLPGVQESLNSGDLTNILSIGIRGSLCQ